MTRCPSTSPLSTAADADAVRVASVPASHVYVRHLRAPDRPDPTVLDPASSDRVVRLADPPPVDGRSVPGGWWPPAMLQGPTWIDAHHDEFDVFHAQFGFDAVSLDELAAALGALERHRKPLVLTVHDLRNPHQPDPAPHRERLDLLMAQAAQVITLTKGAAEAIETTWGRTATVLPHPHVVPADLVGRPKAPRDTFLVGLHAKSRRACMDPVPVAHALMSAVEELDGARLQINFHDELLDPDNHFYDPTTAHELYRLSAHPLVDVHCHRYFDDTQLWAYLASLDLSVLPYRFGTHSGWLEACFDLGTAVAAPSCGFYAEQRPCQSYELTETTWEPATLIDAVHAAAAEPAPQATWPERQAERVALASEHARIYEDVRT